MTKTTNRNLYTVIALAIAVFALLAYSFTGAQWTDAPANPPSNNTPAPVNVGPDAQVKAGGLGANVLMASSSVWSDQYCDKNGENCLNTASIYVCPYVDKTSTGDGDCGSTCVGQMGITSSCVDYEQYRDGTNDRRCRERLTYQCVAIGESFPPDPEATWWTGEWTDWYVVPPNPTTCRHYFTGRDTGEYYDYPCRVESRTRVVECRNLETGLPVEESSCPSRIVYDTNVLKPESSQTRNTPLGGGGDTSL